MKQHLTQYFYLTPLHCQNRVLEVLDFRKDDRAPLGLGNLSPGAPHQMWAFIPREDGGYEIVNRHSRKVLDDSHCSTSPGGPVYQFGRHNGANQAWSIKKATSNDEVVILSKIGSLALDVACSRRERNAQIVLWKRIESPNQIWRLIPA